MSHTPSRIVIFITHFASRYRLVVCQPPGITSRLLGSLDATDDGDRLRCKMAHGDAGEAVTDCGADAAPTSAGRRRPREGEKEKEKDAYIQHLEKTSGFSSRLIHAHTSLAVCSVATMQERARNCGAPKLAATGVMTR